MNLQGVYRAVANVTGKVTKGAGQQGYYVEQVSGTYDTATGKVSAAEKRHTVYAVFEEIAANLVDGTVIQAGDRWALVAASDLAVRPRAGAALRFGNMDMQIVRVREINPGGRAIAYQLQVRR